MRAVITAGGPIEGEYQRRAGTDRKALAPVRGRTMVERTIDALIGCGIHEIAVVGNGEVARVCEPLGACMIADGGSGTGNILRALDAWRDDDALLYLTCDMPYIDAASVQWLIARIDPRGLSMPLTQHEAYFKRFPGAPDAGITLHGERVINGGVFHIPGGAAGKIRTLATALFEARKAPWRMATIAGPMMLMRFITGRASVPLLEARAQALLGIPVRALRDAPPELAFDADGIEEYDFAIAHE
jgi:GTP:adenosylcobinamide-phosphate guanylyltransferase